MAEVSRQPAMCCPHCDSKAIVRSSKQVGEMTRDLTYVCTNDDCNHRFVGQLTIVHTTRRSELPRATVHLPFRPSAGTSLGEAIAA